MRTNTVAAVRGAITVSSNTAEHVREATARLLSALMERNRLQVSQVVSAVFTATPDLDADFPAHAARRLGWTAVPLLGAQEIPVRGALARVVRVLLTVVVASRAKPLTPVYLDGAAALRPDLTGTAAAKRGRRARRVAIVGLGQIGGSIGLALGRDGGWRRVGFDVRPAVRRDAVRRGVVDAAEASLEAACRDAELAIVSVPVDVLPRTIDRVARSLRRGATLVDTGSARSGVTPALARAAGRGIRAVGGHPLAGTEGRGLDAASADRLAGAGFVLLPVRGRVPPLARALVRALGARPIVASPGAHDRSLARTSHLPYLVACGLASVGAAAKRRGLSGPGFRDMTRLAASDPRMALAYVRANADGVTRAWRELREDVDQRVAALTTARAGSRGLPRGDSASKRRTRRRMAPTSRS
jgi:prephenate dehydrogenase